MGAEDIAAIRSRRNLPRRFEDLARYSERVIRCTAQLSKAEFLRDHETIAATERLLSVIGDLVDTLDGVERQLCSGADLMPFNGLGDYLIHGYDAVDPHKVWSIARNDVPLLKAAAERTLYEHFPEATV